MSRCSRVRCSRGGCSGSGAVAAALFALYISLVPFQFHRPSADLAGALSAALSMTMVSRANFIANIVLFVPIAFMSAAGLGVSRFGLLEGVGGDCRGLPHSQPDHRVAADSCSAKNAEYRRCGGTDRRRRAWACAMVRSWQSNRTVARAGQDRRTSPSLETVLTVYVGLRTLALLLPLDVTVSVSNLAEKYRAGYVAHRSVSGRDERGRADPGFHDRHDPGRPDRCPGADRRDRRPQPPQRSCCGSFLSTLFLGMLEASQVIIISRVADTTDLISGAVGAAVGAMMIGPVRPARGGGTPNRESNRLRAVCGRRRGPGVASRTVGAHSTSC